MAYCINILLGILPSIIWLTFYLKQDKHPESKRMILKIFCYGILIAVPAILIEKEAFAYFSKIGSDYSLMTNSILNIFIGVAFVEEFLKYLVVKLSVFRHSEFDEPVDVVIYMIVSALGFAAIENVLYLFPFGLADLVNTTLPIITVRFFGTTLLHALCSGTLGYFLAMSFFETKKRPLFLVSGIIMVTLLHGLYNFSIIEISRISEGFYLLINIAILLFLSFFLGSKFSKLKKLKSVCKI
jgi:RsiW-degrading membrane proteinase PrsW (M82 family)